MNHDETIAVKQLFDSISITAFRTRGGSLAVSFVESGGGDKPLIGAYYTGEEWIACQWTKKGEYVPDDSRKLDLIMVAPEKEIA